MDGKEISQSCEPTLNSAFVSFWCCGNRDDPDVNRIKKKTPHRTPPAATVIVTLVSASAFDAESGIKTDWLKIIRATIIQMWRLISISPHQCNTRSSAAMTDANQPIHFEYPSTQAQSITAFRPVFVKEK